MRCGGMREMKPSKELKRIESRAMPFIQAVRDYWGEPPLRRLDYRTTENVVGYCPIAGALARCGYRNVYSGVVDCDDSKNAATRLAEIWKGEAERMEMMDFCCHRHFKGDKHWVVKLPSVIIEYLDLYMKEVERE